MSSLSKDNEKIEKSSYDGDDAWYLQMLGKVQRLVTLGMAVEADQFGLIDTVAETHNLLYFLEEVEEAIFDGRINGAIGSNPYWERRSIPQV